MTTDNNLPALMEQYDKWASGYECFSDVDTATVAKKSIALNKRLVGGFRLIQALEDGDKWTNEIATEMLELAKQHGVE